MFAEAGKEGDTSGLAKRKEKGDKLTKRKGVVTKRKRADCKAGQVLVQSDCREAEGLGEWGKS